MQKISRDAEGMEEKSEGSQGKTPLLRTGVADVLGRAADWETWDISLNPALRHTSASRFQLGGYQTPPRLVDCSPEAAERVAAGVRAPNLQRRGRERAESRLQLN